MTYQIASRHKPPIQVGMTVEIQVSSNDYRAVVEHVNPNSLGNDNVIVSGESQQRTECTDRIVSGCTGGLR